MEINKGVLISIQTEDIVNGVLTLPEEVKEISDYVISHFPNLKEIVGKSVTQIGNDNFYDCNALTSVNFPQLTQIGNDNFRYCNALTSVEFPQLTQIGNDNFYDCNALTSVNFPQLTQIGNDNFRVCNALTSVEFPQLTQIGNDNFRYCNALTSVEFPQLTQIGNDNFRVCNALTSVEFPQLTQIGNDNFRVCNALTSVNFPQLTQIGNNNFYDCNALTSVEFPQLTQIGNDNFRYCNALTSVEFPQLTQIGNDNFRVCNALTSVKFKNNNLKIKSVDSYPFVVQTEKTTKGITLYSGYNFNGTNSEGMPKVESAYVAKKDEFTAHGKTVKQAIADLEFKVVAEKLKKEPIAPDTELTVMYYRTITGACDFGCREFMEKNGIPYEVVNDGKTERTIEKKPIKAKDLLPILEENNAYGLQKFKELIRF
jgi:hypothetical protein